MMVTLDNERATIAAADGPVGPFDPINRPSVAEPGPHG
jgi:hypothetical protein